MRMRGHFDSIDAGSWIDANHHDSTVAVTSVQRIQPRDVLLGYRAIGLQENKGDDARVFLQKFRHVVDVRIDTLELRTLRRAFWQNYRASHHDVKIEHD